MTRKIYFQYDTRKHSLLYNLAKFNLILLPVSILLYFILSFNIIIYLMFLALELILIYLNIDILLFEYKFCKYYENLMVQRMRGNDVDKLKNPVIKFKFTKDIWTISFSELGYFNNEEYEKIGKSIERFAKMDFEDVFLSKNQTVLTFVSTRKPIKYTDCDDNINCIKLDSRLSFNPYKQPNIGIFGVTGSGKTTLVNFLVNQFEKKGYLVYYLDPKCEFESANKNTIVEYSKGNILKTLRLINEELENRLQQKHEHQQVIVIIEEMVSLKATLEKDELVEFDKYFKNIMLKGRSLKVTSMVVSQIADADLFQSSGMRENFNVRVNLGYLSSTRCNMLFGCSKKDLPPSIGIIGSGYIYIHGKIYSYTAPRLDEKNEPLTASKGSGTFVSRLKGALNR